MFDEYSTPKEKIIFGLLILFFLISVGLGCLYHSKSKELATSTAALNARLAVKRDTLNAAGSKRISELNQARETIQADIMSYEQGLKDVPGGSLMHQMSQVVIAEMKLLDSLIAEQIVAIETGAPVKTAVSQSEPNPDLAMRLETEIAAKRQDIERLKGDLEYAPTSLMGMTELMGVKTEELNLAVLNRNYLIAKYGLNMPYLDTSVLQADTQEPAPASVTEPHADPSGSGQGGSQPPAAKATGDSVPTVHDVFKDEPGWTFIGNWGIKSESSVMDDRTNVMATRFADIRNNNDKNGNISLINVRCMDNNTDLLVSFAETIETDPRDSTASIEYRIDDGPVITSTWDGSADYKGAFAREPADFIKQLENTRMVSLRVVKDGASAVIETYFSLDGLSQAIVPVQEACGWK
jgi:hypothetical protein